MFPLGDLWRQSLKGEVEACMVFNHQFHEQVIGTCRHFMKRGYILLHFLHFLWLTLYSKEIDIALVMYCHVYTVKNNLRWHLTGKVFVSFQEVDIALGSITITGTRSTVVDFPVSYYETSSGKTIRFVRNFFWVYCKKMFKDTFIQTLV